MHLIDGKKVAQDIKTEVAQEITELGFTPKLAVLLVGDDAASHIYVQRKQKACAKIGIDCEIFTFENSVSETTLIAKITELNTDTHFHAILVQLPLPKHLDTKKIINAIDPKKDVDGFHPKTIDNYIFNRSQAMPGLTEGIIRLLKETNVRLRNKKAVIMSNTYIFGQPLLKALEDEGVEAYWRIPDSDSPELNSRDIIIIAVGKPGFIKAKNLKPGAIIIDVGISRLANGKVVGDVDADSVKDIDGWLTPVPGGVGPVTIAMLMKNTVRLAKTQ